MSRQPLTGVVIDERYELTVTELSRACDACEACQTGGRFSLRSLR